MPDNVEIAVKTHVGMVRTENQDHYCVFQPDDPDIARVKGAFIVVADGMGGHSGGTVASRTAVDAILSAYTASEAKSMHDLLEESIISGNQAVRDKAESNPQVRDMGTTCVSTMVRGSSVMVAHLGDSRCYMFRGDHAEIVTRDHTYLNELVDIGLLTPEQAEGHPDKNIITRCVGMSTTLEIDFNRRDAQKGDAFLMCSDGLSNFVNIDELKGAVAKYSAEDACTWAIDLANKRGGDDNITVAVIKVHETSETTDPELAAHDSRDAQYSALASTVTGGKGQDKELVGGEVDSDADTAEGTKRPDVKDRDESSAAAAPSFDADLAATRPMSRPRQGWWARLFGNGRTNDQSWGATSSGRARSHVAWYWLIGAEIVLLLLLQFWIGKY